MKKLFNWKNQIKSLWLVGALFFGSLFVAGMALATPGGINAPSVPTYTNVATTSFVMNWTHTADTSSTQMILMNSMDGVSFSQMTTTSVTATSALITDPSPPNYNLHIWFQVVASNDDMTVSSTGPSSSIYFAANTPGALTVSASTTSALGIAFTNTTTNGNPATVTYAVYNSTSGNFLDSNGVATTTAVYIASSSWSGKYATGLSPNVGYMFSVIAKNSDGLVTATSTDSPIVYTKANTPGPLILVPLTTSSITISFDATTTNSNSAGTAYAIYNNSSSTFLDANGAATSTAVWQTSSTWPGMAGFAATGLGGINTNYIFSVLARNGGNVQTATSTTSSANTLAAVASVPTVGNATTSSLDFVLGPNSSNPSSTTRYYIREMNSLNYLVTGFVSPTSTLGLIPSAGFLSEWGTTNTLSGLSPNTQYIFKVTAENDNGGIAGYDSAASASSTGIYTLAVAPTSVSASADSNTAITVSWSGGVASSYNVVKGSDTAVTGQTSSHQYTGLTCNTSYTFKVYGVNGDDLVTTDYGTASASTNACQSSGGGTMASYPPTVASPSSAVSVSGNVSDSQMVTLNFSATNAIQIAISEDPNFTSVSWETYTSSKQFKLSSGNGQKTIYVKFRSANGGVTSAYSVQVNTSTGVATSAVQTSSDVAVKSSPVIVSGFALTNPESKVIILPVKKLEYKPGATVFYTYQFKNETGSALKVKVLRQVVDANGKVVTKTNGLRTIAKGKVFKFNASNTIGSKVANGDYTVEVKVTDAKTGEVLEENGFNITVKKPAPVVKKPVVKAPAKKK